jgi:hypothetical protein
MADWGDEDAGLVGAPDEAQWFRRTEKGAVMAVDGKPVFIDATLRDRYVARRITLSRVAREALGVDYTTPGDEGLDWEATACGAAAELAEAYYSEIRTQGPGVENFLVRHFGRATPRLLGVLRYEVRRLSDRAPAGLPSSDLFASVAEEERWTQATRKVMAAPDWDELPFEQRLGLIAAAAGAKLGPGPRKLKLPEMPRIKPLSEEAYNQRMDLLREQARELREPGEEG